MKDFHILLENTFSKWHWFTTPPSRSTPCQTVLGNKAEVGETKPCNDRHQQSRAGTDATRAPRGVQTPHNLRGCRLVASDCSKPVCTNHWLVINLYSKTCSEGCYINGKKRNTEIMTEFNIQRCQKVSNVNCCREPTEGIQNLCKNTISKTQPDLPYAIYHKKRSNVTPTRSWHWKSMKIQNPKTQKLRKFVRKIPYVWVRKLHVQTYIRSDSNSTSQIWLTEIAN